VNERYFLPIGSGLLEPKHVAAIGPAIWVFLWMIHRTTKEQEGEGIVLNGAAIRSQVIAEDLGLRDRTVRDHLNILCDGGYLRRDGEQQSRFGNSYFVKKAKKWWNKAHKYVGENPPSNPNRLGENPPRLGEISPLLGENPPHPHTPLKEEQKGTENNRTPATPPIEPEIDASMVARAVLVTTRLSGQELLRNLTEVAKAEINSGADPEELMARMCAAWEEYAKTPLKWHNHPDKFFGGGLWANKALWAWFDGKGPEDKPKRRYVGDEA
jgi:DNA-binding MarR family transcriptional regulator